MRVIAWLRRWFGFRGLGVAVETSNICNARCVWCWMYNSGRKSTGLMRADDFRRIVDLNRLFFRRNALIPYHRGEPLLHPEFIDLVEYAARAGCRLGDISTNFAVKVDVRRLLQLPLRQIVVNVGGTTREVHEQVVRNTSFDRVVDNLRNAFRLNAEIGRPMVVKMNVTRRNHGQIGLLGDFVRSLGGRPEQARIGTTGLTLPALATAAEKDAFLREVVSDEVQEYLRFTYDLSRPDFGIRSKSSRSLCRFLMPTVKYDGRVTVCCHDQMDVLNLGNAVARPLADILSRARSRLAVFRGLFKRHAFCRECN